MLLLDCAGLVQESRLFDGMLTSSEYNIKNRVAFQGRHKYVEVYDGGGEKALRDGKGVLMALNYTNHQMPSDQALPVLLFTSFAVSVRMKVEPSDNITTIIPVLLSSKSTTNSFRFGFIILPWRVGYYILAVCSLSRAHANEVKHQQSVFSIASSWERKCVSYSLYS